MLRAEGQQGFSFLEVLLAMSILLLGGVAVMALFALVVDSLVQRQIKPRLEQVRTEVQTMAQEAVDLKPPGALPAPIPSAANEPPKNLSLPGFGVRIEFTRSTATSTGVLAKSVVYFQGRPVATIPPIPLVRSTVDPR
jgi:Tfp pilus assembly protein PilV